MRREDYVFCIGYEGSTAIVDGKLMRRHARTPPASSPRRGCSSRPSAPPLWSGSPEELEEVLAIYNQQDRVTGARRSEELKRIFGTSGVPEGVKKVTVV